MTRLTKQLFLYAMQHLRFGLARFGELVSPASVTIMASVLLLIFMTNVSLASVKLQCATQFFPKGNLFAVDYERNTVTLLNVPGVVLKVTSSAGANDFSFYVVGKPQSGFVINRKSLAFSEAVVLSVASSNVPTKTIYKGRCVLQP